MTSQAAIPVFDLAVGKGIGGVPDVGESGVDAVVGRRGLRLLKDGDILVKQICFFVIART